MRKRTQLRTTFRNCLLSEYEKNDPFLNIEKRRKRTRLRNDYFIKKNTLYN